MTRVTRSPAAEVQSTPQLEQKHYVIGFFSISLYFNIEFNRDTLLKVNRSTYVFIFLVSFLYKNGLHLLCFSLRLFKVETEGQTI